MVPVRSTAYAQNMATGRIVGQVTDETGRYELRLRAEVGDQIAVWYRLRFEDSQSHLIGVPAPKDQTEGQGGAGGASD